LFFDLLTDPLGLPINPIWEYVILLVIGEMAFRIAWDASPGGFGGSTIHWLVRIIVFAVIWAVTYAAIAIGQFVVAHWIPIMCIIGGLVVVSISIVLVQKHRIQEK
jgi:CHASE2 domain-containing sensor protein